MIRGALCVLCARYYLFLSSSRRKNSNMFGWKLSDEKKKAEGDPQPFEKTVNRSDNQPPLRALNQSASILIKCFHLSGAAASSKIASTGQTGSRAPQSMPPGGSI